MTTAKTLEKLVKDTAELYTLPAVAVEVLRLADDPRSDVEALRSCLERDPALTAKILRVVNSSLFGLSAPVANLGQALALLGTKPLRLLVLGFSLPPGLFEGVEADVLARYWRHTLTRAAAARQLAEQLHCSWQDEVFLAALLRDLGQLLLVQRLKTSYCRFLQTVLDKKADILTWEQKALGFDHVQLTAKLLETWHLPELIIHGIIHSTLPPQDQNAFSARSAEQVVPAIVWLAELLALGIVGGDHQSFATAIKLLERHEITGPQLEQFVEQLKTTVEQLAQILSVPLMQQKDYVTVLREAHLKLAKLGEEIAAEACLQHIDEPLNGGELEEHCEWLAEAIELLATSPNATAASSQQAAASKAKPTQLPNPATKSDQHGTTHVPSRTSRPVTASSLYSLRDDPGITAKVAAAVSACRQGRCPLTVMLVEFHDVEQLLITQGPERLQRLAAVLEKCCWQLDHPMMECVPWGNFGWMLILPDCDRKPAIELGHELLERFRHLLATAIGSDKDVAALAIGAATVSLPPKNFPADELLEAAQRCLNGSHMSGGGVVKSIEIF